MRKFLKTSNFCQSNWDVVHVRSICLEEFSGGEIFNPDVNELLGLLDLLLRLLHLDLKRQIVDNLLDQLDHLHGLLVLEVLDHS